MCYLFIYLFILIGDNTTLLNMIEALKEIGNKFTKDNNILRGVSSSIWGVVEGSSKVQMLACENGVISFLLNILRTSDDDKSLTGSIVGSLGVLLSSPESFKKYCTAEIISEVEKTLGKFSDSEKIKMFLSSIKRIEDDRVSGAISRGVCTKSAFPKCSDGNLCDENYYCDKCCVQQKVFRCLDCDKNVFNFYCETCWSKAHKGHRYEEFFYPVRCVGLPDNEDDNNGK